MRSVDSGRIEELRVQTELGEAAFSSYAVRKLKRPRLICENDLCAVVVLLCVTLTNIIGLPGDQAALESDHLDGIQADLEYIVEESQKRREGERCHKYGREAKLDHWRKNKQFSSLIRNYSLL